MSILDEAAQAEYTEQVIDEGAAAAAEFAEQAAPKSRMSDMMPDFSVLFSPTGPGPVSDYYDHPFNINESKGVARILRGLTGIAGNLDYAIVDITLGAVEVYQEGHKKKEASNESVTFPE